MPTGLTSSLHDSDEEMHRILLIQNLWEKQPGSPELPGKHSLYL